MRACACTFVKKPNNNNEKMPAHKVPGTHSAGHSSCCCPARHRESFHGGIRPFGFDVSATARHAACGKHARNPCAHACESGYLSLIIDLSQTPRARVPFTPHATGTRTLERTGLFAFGDFVPPPQFMAASHASFSWPGRSPGPAPSN